ncbi:Kinesin family [Teratosphaeria destructans]|uniref:Kinesin family n=1 Tax=Teratosphaeria destructans TaxID=418781 RepID=A0A9W7T0U0_9PEZI|nr:Kinesin family [Teratosphaeria destructans]
MPGSGPESSNKNNHNSPADFAPSSNTNTDHPPTSPSSHVPSSWHQTRPSTGTATATATTMQRAKRSSSRITDGAASRMSDEDVAKTAVKVAVRVRPPLQPTDPGFDLIPQRFRTSTCEVPTPSNLTIQSDKGKKLFIFDRVFDEKTTQDGVWDYLRDSVSAFVKGYNVSILAYGQSGSGKSYTMGTAGPDGQEDPQMRGIVPRAAQTLFEKLNGGPPRQPGIQTGIQTPKRYSTQGIPTLSAMRSAGGTKTWELKATYVEIYKEELRDLLVPEHVAEADRQKVAIREDAKGRILLTGLHQVNINSPEDLLNALSFGSSIRQTGFTDINARSSRSHAVFSLNLIQRKTDNIRPGSPTPRNEKRMSVPLDVVSGAENIVTIDSKLHFVDLAGSERLKNTGATGDRAKEGININAGLAALGKVISQLSHKQGNAHISYRDSRLTRLLQDSLGGNAITYMIACVTPAVFHLSETLNTVTYAQRARAIQSKPEIQQSHEDGDKQAAIERLRAEVSFLRDQIRHADQSETKGTNGRSDKVRGREAELQTQILDMEESYQALSQRHAKLIAELSKARGADVDTPLLKEAVGASATERIERSNSFAEAVEQMVLEYEKTIQSLETNLTQTKMSLSNQESTLLEKETRIAYMETIQAQLQARIQKAVDREQSNESYLRDLENQMEGTSSGEERSAALIAELKKELSRVRETESSAEDYISTLEERLAEAEQDQEIMQREIDRLEHVVERQRSIGRLDNLLGELDGFHPNGLVNTAPAAFPVQPDRHMDSPSMNGHRESYDPFRPQTPGQETDARDNEEYRDDDASVYSVQEGRDIDHFPSPLKKNIVVPALALEQRSPAQNDFMADKVENLTQELFDLRSDHESTLLDYDKLQQKYQTALETLAKLQYDELRPKSPSMPTASGPDPFLANAGMRGEEEAHVQVQPSSSRSLSAELASHGPLNISEETKDDQAASGSDSEHGGQADETAPQTTERPSTGDRAEMEKEMEMLKQLHAEKEVSVSELTNNYKSLALRHTNTLAQVELLKQEVSKAQNGFRPASPGLNRGLRRRKSEDILGATHDRTSRSYASLKNIALENFETNPDTRQSFELNLNTVMGELHNRTERLQSVEAELNTVKKELDNKQQIITGLTRERSTLAASPAVDFSVLGQMRDQLMESEHQIRTLHEQHAIKEKELRAEIDTLKASLTDHQRMAAAQVNQLPTPNEDRQAHMPGDFPQTPALESIEFKELDRDHTVAGATRAELDNERAADIARLQNELAAWETRHHDAMACMKASEARLMDTIVDLEESIRTAGTGAVSGFPAPATASEPVSRSITGSNAATAQALKGERRQQKSIVEALEKEINQYKTTASNHVSKFDQLEQSYAKILRQVDEDSKTRNLTQTELQTHKDLVANLEAQLQVHKDAINMHQETLESLQANHSSEMNSLKAAMEAQEQQSKQKLAELEEHHSLVIENMSADLLTSQRQVSDMLRNASSALGYETSPEQLHTHIKGLVDEGKELHTRHLKTTNELKSVQEELQSALNHTVSLEHKIGELKMINEEAILNLEKLSEKEKKSARLVEELEEQLNSTFDSHQQANHRMSLKHSETIQARMELERELEEHKMRNSLLEQQLATLKRQSAASTSSAANFNRESLSPEAAAIALARSGSQTSTSRKSGAPTALPTPPPSIPLPPLPGTPSTAQFPDRAGSPVHAHRTPTTSPPGSRHTSKDVGPSMSQLLEESEARIRTIEKHLFAEKQLTATLEEALVDLETSANRTKTEMDSYRKKCASLEDELVSLRKDRNNSRASLQAVEEEREMRVRAEKARQALEQRMMELNNTKKKKKNALNCF